MLLSSEYTYHCTEFHTNILPQVPCYSHPLITHPVFMQVLHTHRQPYLDVFGSTTGKYCYICKNLYLYYKCLNPECVWSLFKIIHHYHTDKTHPNNFYNTTKQDILYNAGAYDHSFVSFCIDNIIVTWFIWQPPECCLFIILYLWIIVAILGKKLLLPLLHFVQNMLQFLANLCYLISMFL